MYASCRCTHEAQGTSRANVLQDCHEQGRIEIHRWTRSEGRQSGRALRPVRRYEHEKAISALVRLGLQGQEDRKREFFRKLKANLESDDPKQQDKMVDEFRTLILGR